MRFVVRLPPITKLLQLIPSMVDEYPVNMALKRLGSRRIEYHRVAKLEILRVT